MTNGTAYPTAALLTADYQLNEELFRELGVPRLSAQGTFCSSSPSVSLFPFVPFPSSQC